VPGAVRQGLEGKPARLCGQQAGKAVGPFDDHDAGFVQNVIPARREHCLRSLVAVEIEVEDRQAAVAVFMDEGEGRAGDGGLRAEPGNDALGGLGLAGTERAAQGHDRAGGQGGAQRVAPGPGVFRSRQFHARK